MKIHFLMWRTALWQLVKISDKREWEALDVVSRWLIATRSAVALVTIYSCTIAGLLAWREGYFDWLAWGVLTLGLFIAHGTNNLLNDYTDYTRGVDKDNYFRTQYGVHPLVQNFWTKRQQLQWFAISGVLAVLSGIYALFYTQFNPLVAGLFAFGSLVLLFYTWPLKYWALGEFAIFLIWGPVMIAGVYFVLVSGQGGGLGNLWNVALAGIPFGLSVASINVAKHIDKRDDDLAKGVSTMPVRVGEKAARSITAAALLMIYAVVVYLVFLPRYFTPIMLIVFLAGKRALQALSVLRHPRPLAPPQGWPAWPVWFSAFAFHHNRAFGGLFILGLLVETLLRVVPPAADFIMRFWPAA